MNRYILIIIVLIAAVGYGYLLDNPNALKPDATAPVTLVSVGEFSPAEVPEVEEGELAADESSGETLE